VPHAPATRCVPPLLQGHGPGSGRRRRSVQQVPHHRLLLPRLPVHTTHDTRHTTHDTRHTTHDTRTRYDTHGLMNGRRAEGEVLHRVECFYVKKLGHLMVNLEILLLLRIVIARWLETLSSQKVGTTQHNSTQRNATQQTTHGTHRTRHSTHNARRTTLTTHDARNRGELRARRCSIA
jgi:hypothetical protein